MRTRGFTLLELIVIVAIVGILLAVSIPALSRFRQQQALQHTTEGLLALLADARTKTLAALNDTSYGVYLESTQATLFVGTTYIPNTPTNETYEFETPATATWNLTPSGATISFARLTGSPSSHGTIELSIPSGTTKTITITALGALSKE